MAVSALNWKYIGNTTLGSSETIDGVLDAIYNLLNSSTYYDGTSRTPGSGVAWSPTKYTDTVTKAVYCEPSSSASSTCRGMRVIFAGEDVSANSSFPRYHLNTGPGTHESASTAPTTNHTWLQACLFGGLAKNAGSFTNITPGAAVTPFTSGGFTGFAKISQENHFSSAKLFLYESLDAIYFVIQDGGSLNNECNHFAAGGLYDPGSDAATDSEADEVVYGLLSTGNEDNDMSFDLNQSLTKFPNFNNNNNQPVAVTFSVGATTYTLQAIHHANWGRRDANGSGGSEVTFTRSGRRTLFPIYANQYFAVGGNRNVIGRLREIFLAGHVLTGQKLTGGGSDLGYYVAPRATGATNAYTGFLLKA